MRGFLVRACGLLALYLLVQWVGITVSDAMVGPTGPEAFERVSGWDALIMGTVMFGLGLVVRRDIAAWAAASVVYLAADSYGTPVLQGTAVFWWGYASTVAMVAGLGLATLLPRRQTA